MTTTEMPPTTEKGTRGPERRRAQTRERVPVPEGRRTMPAGRVLIVMLVALMVWALLYAPSLKRASEAQPLGLRRTVSLWVLTPLAALSNVTQLTKLTDAASSALGRDPNEAPGGEVVIPPDELPTVSGSPPPRHHKQVERTTKIRVPTPSNKLRAVVVGDSLSQGLGVYLERTLRSSLVRVSKQGRISTGLARLDYFDWMSGLQKIENLYRPDLVFVLIGENDNQGLQSPGGQLETDIGSYEWPRAYEQRAEQFARIAVDSGSHMVWVGLPVVKDEDRWPVLQRQNAIYQRVARQTPNVTFLDTWDLVDAPDGGYTPFARGPSGNVQEIREPDGVHFNGTGYELVARAAVDAAIDAFNLTPRALSD
jgi:hypothetical protein